MGVVTCAERGIDIHQLQLVSFLSSRPPTLFLVLFGRRTLTTMTVVVTDRDRDRDKDRDVRQAVKEKET